MLTGRSALPRWRHTVPYVGMAALLLLMGGSVYIPFLENPLIFDDFNLFHTSELTRAATTPWDYGPRGIPYFTLGWVQTQIGTMAAHRTVSLALHVLVAYQLFRFLESVLSDEISPAADGAGVVATRARCAAALVSIAFLCHPAATYASGYLVQRTAVFATLFALLCLRSLLAAFRKGDLGLAAQAGFWASLSVMSKEHYVLVPIASLALALLRPPHWRSAKVGAVFIVVSIPAMAIALYKGLYAVGRAYEPALHDLASELFSLPELSGHYERWLLSASTQAQLYFEYWRVWLMPSTRRMSIDLRVDFLRPWEHWSAWAWLCAWTLLPLLATLASLRWRGLRLIAFALSFNAVLFVVELSTVRFQEPHVLYRSYIWAIGYGTLVAALLARLPLRLGLVAFAIAIPLLVFQSVNRLRSLQAPLALWEDAAAKLPKMEIAGGTRILFNRGRARYVQGDLDGATSDINLAIQLSPTNGQYRIARAETALRSGRPHEAIADLDAAGQWMVNDERLLFSRYRVLTVLGRVQEAEASLAEAARLGSFSAKLVLARRRSLDGNATVEMNANR